jgi:glycosyltransferase involved in cell wall biosynthesis
VWSKPYWLKYLGPLGYIAALVEKWSLLLPNSFIAVSDMTRSRLVAEGVSPEKITLIENTLDIDGIREAETLLPSTDLLFVGRLISHKRLDLILCALQELKNIGIRPTLSIVGTGPERLNLLNQAHNLGISEQITFFCEGLESSDVWGLMKKCPIFVLPSEREGYGIAVQEALLVGATVLVSNHPDNAARHLVEKTTNGRIVKEQNKLAWADSLKDLIEFGQSRKSVSKSPLLLEDSPIDNFVSDYQFSWNQTLAVK